LEAAVVGIERDLVLASFVVARGVRDAQAARSN